MPDATARYDPPVQIDSASDTATDDQAPVVIDEALLEQLEHDLADAAQALEQVELICAAGQPGEDTARSIRGLLDDDRFAVSATAPPVDAEIDDPSDLIGNGHVDATEQIHPVTEHERVGGAAEDPSGAEVGDAFERRTERPLHLVDQSAVGDDDRLTVADGFEDAAEPTQRPLP